MNAPTPNESSFRERLPIFPNCVVLVISCILLLLVIWVFLPLPAHGDTRPPNLIKKLTSAPKLTIYPEILSLIVMAPPGTTFGDDYTSARFYTRDGELVRVVWTSIRYPERQFITMKPVPKTASWQDVADWGDWEAIYKHDLQKATQVKGAHQ